jgi:hypothetical protein
MKDTASIPAKVGGTAPSPTTKPPAGRGEVRLRVDILAGVPLAFQTETLRHGLAQAMGRRPFTDPALSPESQQLGVGGKDPAAPRL